jgi:GntR family transcriptional regulator
MDPVDPAQRQPLHEQVASKIRRAVADGEAVAGKRLPPARDLAAVLGVNVNTVLRALRELREDGLLEFRRGREVRVAGDAVPRVAVTMKVQELVRYAHKHGYGTEELLRMIQLAG